MLVEHLFITTLDAPEALAAASALLGSRGFVPVAQPAESRLPALELRRGRANPARARSVAELPQQVRIEWDRGRVTVAASLSPRMWAGRQYPPGAWITVPAKTRQPDQENLLLSIARALESHLANRVPIDEACAEWDRLDAGFAVGAKSVGRRKWIVAVLVLMAGLGGLALAIYSNSHR